MLVWLQGFTGFTWLEFFAGSAACTAHVRARGNPGCKFDIKYHQERFGNGKSDFMDINSVSGFVLLGEN